jgi:hypothetical protein
MYIKITQPLLQNFADVPGPIKTAQATPEIRLEQD